MLMLLFLLSLKDVGFASPNFAKGGRPLHEVYFYIVLTENEMHVMFEWPAYVLEDDMHVV